MTRGLKADLLHHTNVRTIQAVAEAHRQINQPQSSPGSFQWQKSPHPHITFKADEKIYLDTLLPVFPTFPSRPNRGSHESAECRLRSRNDNILDANAYIGDSFLEASSK